MLSPYFYIVGQGPIAESNRAETIAILGLEVIGTVDSKTVRIARALTAALRSRAANGPYAIAPIGDQDLIDLKIMHNCPDERKECMIKIGRALNAQYLLYGRIERRAQGAAPSDGYQISLQLLNVNSGHLTAWADFIPAAESSDTRIAERGRSSYEHLLTDIRPRGEQHVATDHVLTNATNATFWQITRYKPGQKLDMSDPQDRSMAKRWMDIYKQVRSHRDRATSLAKRLLNELVTPYILVIEQRIGSLTHRTFERPGNLAAQYSWLLDQPEKYTYLAMFDFTQNRAAPIRDQFSLSKRQQMATSGW